MKQSSLLGIALGLCICLASNAHAQQAVPDQVVAQIQQLAAAPEVVAAVKAQNARNANLAQAEIDKLDRDWRAQTGGGNAPLVKKVLENELSRYLKSVKQQAGGMYNEVFVMDMKGLNVGQSDVTSDYWQGDEAKWQKTYGAGAGSVFIDDVEFDESTQAYQAQVSMAVSDPDTNEVIGAITVGVNVDG